MSDRPNPPQPPVLLQDVEPHHSGPAARLRNYFLTGLILVGPLYITINLTWWLINWADDVMRPFIPVWLRTETYLTYRIPGIGLIVAFFALTLLGFLTANLVGRTLVEARREAAQPHADRAADLQDDEADFRDAVRQGRLELPQGGAGGISGRHVVGGVPGLAAERLHRGAAARARIRVLLPAVHAEPDHRLLLLRAAQPGDRARHHGRAGDDADHVGRHGAAERRRAEEACRAGRYARARRPRRSPAK